MITATTMISRRTTEIKTRLTIYLMTILMMMMLMTVVVIVIEIQPDVKEGEVGEVHPLSRHQRGPWKHRNYSSGDKRRRPTW